MAICIYPPFAEDFTTNGLGILTPLECTVEEVAAGKYELELVHPIDNTLRWMQIANGCIVKVPAPVRENPLYEAPAMGEPVTITRQVWVVSGTTHGLYIRTGPGMNYKRIGVKKNGVEVLELEDAEDPWKKVCVLNSGQVGYMSTKYLKPLRTETEIIEPAKPVGGSILKIGQSREQLFRIYSVEQDSEAATVTAKALHVFYDDNGNLIDADYEIAEGKTEEVNAVMANINSKLALPRETVFQAINLTGDITGNFSYKTPVEAYLDPDEGIVSQTKAMLVRDNWDAYLLPDMVRDRGVTVRRGKNLIGVEVTNDISGIVTRIIPVGKNKNGDPLYLNGTKWVDSPHISEYQFPRIKRIEYDVQTGKDGFGNDNAVRDEIRRLAEEDFSKNGVDLPKYGMEVDFVLLGNTAEYADYASLQAVHLYDTVTVIDEMLGLKAKVRVTGYTWNCLTEQYEKVTLGELQDVQQTVYSYNLPNAGISGTKIMNNSLSGAALRNATIEYAKIAVAAIQQLTADSLTALTARIQELVAGSVTTDDLYAGIADITKATIETADIAWADIDELNAAIATLVQANIGTADIDFAHIKDMVTDTAIITEGVGGQLFISRLAVTDANMVSLTTGELVVKGDDGHFYSLSVDAEGKVVTTLKQLNNDDVQDLSINAGEKLIEGSVTAACLNAREIFADNAIIRQLIAANLDVDALFAREAFVNLLRTSKIVNDKSIEMIVGEVEDQERLSSIEVVEGTFVQADRREGKGVHVFGEFGPKQKGTPYPPGGGKNKFDVERASDIANWGTGPTWAYYELVSTPGTYHFSYNPTVTRIDNFILNISRSTDGSSGDSITLIYVDVSRTECTFELKEGEKLYFNCFFGNGFTQANLTAFVEGALVEAQLELGTVTTPFEPYAGIFPVIGRNALTFEHLGKNLFNVDSQTSGGITVSKNDDGAHVLNGTATSFQMIRTTCDLPYGTYILSSLWLPDGVYVRVRDAAGSILGANYQGAALDHKFTGTPGICEFTIQSGVSLDSAVIQSQLEYVSASTHAASPYEPYHRKPYTVEFSETVYGGKVDCYTGEVAAGWGLIESYAGEELPGEWLSDRDVYAEGATPTVGAQVVYKLETPVKISASPAWPAAFDGINTIYTDAESGYVEFGHDLPEVIDGAMAPASPAAGAIWLDRSVTPAVLRRFNGSEWETLNDTTEIINAQNALQQQQQELKDKQAETDLYLKLDSANKVVRIGQTGVTSEYIIDAFGSGVSINNEIFSRFEANRVVFGDMEMRKPTSVGGLAFDSITT